MNTTDNNKANTMITSNVAEDRETDIDVTNLGNTINNNLKSI